MIEQLTIARLREALRYDPSTGHFTWLISRGTVAAGARANCGNGKYGHIRLDKKTYRAHRLAWFYMTGEWPEDQIDHWNGDKRDNRWDNLRDATNSQNCANAKLRSDNSVGLKGVSRQADSQRFRARIRQQTLGIFDCPAAAHFAYVIAAAEDYGEFARAR